ncbi:kinase [Kosmotoga arenicorallina S304]|uniref:Kinase n=1 Tax=Kosmotoga arenicorallina S304 TaxID=1453497 RepID=A0A182C7S8_9BACT|nr:RNase adapter RapZ [Kosmotoga arenicorallina]OAA31758.1 kinase [Kosmotoga arenicorallina S304]
MAERNLILLTGMSGAGKTSALKFLEDFGFFSVDNVPPAVFHDFYEILKRKEMDNLAVVVDIRAISNFKSAEAFIAEIQKAKENLDDVTIKIIFLDADDEIIKYRYGKTRRAHPLMKEYTLAEAIRKEREMMKPLMDIADEIINTSNMDTKEMHERLLDSIKRELSKIPPIRVIIESFSYVNGVPQDANLVFDVRFLPNPYYIAGLSELTGKNREIGEFLEKFERMGEYLSVIKKVSDITIEEFSLSGRNQIKIAVGCTGGRHRSVYIAEKLYETMQLESRNVSLIHRELRKDGE